MKWAVVENTAPPVEPVTLAEARDHLLLDAEGSPPTHPADDLVEALITAARQWVEGHLGYAIIQRQFQLVLDQFPGSAVDTIALPRSNLRSIDSVEYVDTDGNTQAWAASNYSADTASAEGRLLRAYYVDWPATRAQRQAVTITYTAGYADDGASPADYRANVPEAIKAAIKLLLGDLYANRENVQIGTITSELKGPAAVLSLLSPYRRMYL